LRRKPFQIIRIVDEFTGLNDNYIIKKVKYDLWGADEGGSRTTIFVAPVNAFQLLSEQEKHKKKKKKKGKGSKYATQSEIDQTLYYDL